MTSGRVVEAHRTFQDHTLDVLSSLMALRYGGSNVGVNDIEPAQRGEVHLQRVRLQRGDRAVNGR